MNEKGKILKKKRVVKNHSFVVCLDDIDQQY